LHTRGGEAGGSEKKDKSTYFGRYRQTTAFREGGLQVACYRGGTTFLTNLYKGLNEEQEKATAAHRGNKVGLRKRNPWEKNLPGSRGGGELEAAEDFWKRAKKGACKRSLRKKRGRGDEVKGLERKKSRSLRGHWMRATPRDNDEDPSRYLKTTTGEREENTV